MSGIVCAKLDAGGGDWDLAVFDSAGRTVAGSAGLQRRRGRVGVRRPGRSADRAGLPALGLGRLREAWRSRSPRSRPAPAGSVRNSSA